MRGALSRLAVGLGAGLLSLPALALDNIVQPYFSARMGGMGGLRTMTGLYEENFYYNPARITANPRARLMVLDIGADFTPAFFRAAGVMLSNPADPVAALTPLVGNNIHARGQVSLLSLFLPAREGSRLAVAFSLISPSVQADLNLRQSYLLEARGLLDIWPVLGMGLKLLEDNSLSVGASLHPAFRVAANQTYGVFDYFLGNNPSPNQIGGLGLMIDFDVGATYRLPVKAGDFVFEVGLSANNIMGGTFSNIPLPTGLALPTPQTRSFSVGASAIRAKWWKLDNTTLALEVNNIGNNIGGSAFRLIHLGGETHYGVVALRAGFNQGYFCAGVGVDARMLVFDFSTYGEEMSFNAGYAEDRRLAFRIGLPIQW